MLQQASASFRQIQSAPARCAWSSIYEIRYDTHRLRGDVLGESDFNGKSYKQISFQRPAHSHL